MHWLRTAGFLVLALYAVAIEVQAGTFPFPFSFSFPGSSDRGDQRPPPGPGPWQYRPQPSSNARGVPPGYQPPAATPDQTGGYQQPGFQQPVYQQPDYRQPWPGYQRGWPGPYQAPYGQYAPPQAGTPPRLELEIGDSQPYVQENLLLKLRVVSDENLETANPELPSSNDVLLQKVQGPKASERVGAQGRTEIVNEYVYTLTPLRAGSVEVPPLRVTGTTYGNGYGYGQMGGRRFEATSSEPIRLQVRPAMASVRPWLPLQDLSLKATLDSGAEVEEGKPVTLALEVSAEGATGSQLPSLESLLHSPDFRAYREQTLNEAHLSPDGRRLQGKRTEYYTLVPTSGGKLQLPEIRLAWWNVTTGATEYASLPIHTLQADGASGLSDSAEMSSGGGLRWLWLALVGVVLLLLGYWGGAWIRGGGFGALAKGGSEVGMIGAALGERLGLVFRKLAASASTGATELVRRMDPAPLVARMNALAAKAMPPSTRFLSCVRAANREEDPAAWAERFQDLTCQHLHFSTQTPLPGVTGRILALRPGAESEQLERLMQQLDGALYGNQDIDFKRWKKQFHSQVGRRRGLASTGRRRLHLTLARLPELNPPSA